MEISIQEASQARAVAERVRQATRSGQRVSLPDFDSNLSRPSEFGALLSVGIESNDFGGTMGPFRYQFEGEEDLLHLIVTKQDESEITVPEAREVLRVLLPTVPSALVWLKPGEHSQHFYIGHEALLTP